MTNHSSSLELYFDEVSKRPLLSDEEQKQLALEIQQGNTEAKTRLVESNLRFVISVASEYKEKTSHLCIDLEDLISAGNLGLVIAAERFNPSGGYKFITYAVWRIRQSIHNLLTQESKTVRLSYNLVRDIQRITKASPILAQKTEETNPSLDDLAEYLSVNPKKITRALIAMQTPVYLDKEYEDKEGEKNPVHKFIPDESQPLPDEEVLDNDLKRKIEKALNKLPPREAHILSSYFGLNGTSEKNLEQIGYDVGDITRERVRQIKERALRTLRQHPTLSRELRAYLRD